MRITFPFRIKQQSVVQKAENLNLILLLVSVPTSRQTHVNESAG